MNIFPVGYALAIILFVFEKELVWLKIYCCVLTSHLLFSFLSQELTYYWSLFISSSSFLLLFFFLYLKYTTAATIIKKMKITTIIMILRVSVDCSALFSFDPYIPFLIKSIHNYYEYQNSLQH